MPVVKPTSVPTKRLASSIIGSDMSFQASDILGWDGEALVAADFGDEAYGCFRDANGTVLELFEFDPDTIASSSITILRRGLQFDGDRTTEVAANKLEWVKGTTLVELGTTMPQFFQWLKEYIDAAAIAGGVPATTSVLGIARMSAVPVSSSDPIVVGTNDPRVPGNDYGTSAAGTDTYAITLSPAPTAYVAGQQYAFKADVANTGAATLNVNGLGAKSLVKNGSTALATGDILVGQVVVARYDGTNMQIISLLSPVLQTVAATVVYANGQSSKNLTDATAGTTVIAHGLGTTPRAVRIKCAAGSGTTGYTTDGIFSNSTYASMRMGYNASGIEGNEQSTTYIVKLTEIGGAGYQTATVAVDSTNITLTWTKSASPTGTISFLWEAEGYTTASVT